MTRSPWDPYLDLEHGVLRNLLGITDPADLAAAEAEVSGLQLTRLAEEPVTGDFDLQHLLAIHTFLFGSIYEWAGTLRTVALGKNAQPFCPPEQLAERSARIFLGLAARDHLRGLDRESFLDSVTELLDALLWLHPTREGNGRTIRAFLAQLADHAGYRLRWAGMDAETNRRASRKAYDGNLKPMRAMLDQLLASRHQDS